MSFLDGHIVIHLEDPAGSNKAACDGGEIQSYPDFMEKKYGFIQCPACALRAQLTEQKQAAASGDHDPLTKEEREELYGVDRDVL
jgi:hypothetical protein